MCEGICECKQHCVYVASDGGCVSTPTHIIPMILLSLKQISEMNVEVSLLIIEVEYLFVHKSSKKSHFECRASASLNLLCLIHR